MHPFIFSKAIKYTALFFSLLMYAGHTVAQSDYRPGIEISCGAGIASSDELFDGYKGVLIGQYKETIINKYSGAFNVGIKYIFPGGISFGIMGAYEKESGDWQKNVNVGDINDWLAVREGTFTRQAYTLVAEVRAYYDGNNEDGNIVRGYLTAAAGITLQQETDRYSDSYYNAGYYNGVNTYGNNQQITNNRYHFNGYFSPAGISIGRRLSWYAELGIGYKGIINTGLILKL